MKFNKEYFENYKPITKGVKLDELIDVDGSKIEGDLNPSYGDIQTGPVNKSFNDNSDYVKGLPTTTDKRATYAQPRSWWALYYGYGGTPYSHGNKTVSEGEITEALVEKNDNSDIVKKSNDVDLIKQLEKIGDLIEKSNLPKKDKEKMLNVINDSKI